MPLRTEHGDRRAPWRARSTSLAIGWTLLVIRDLFGGKTRYGDFLASGEKIPTNILADRLKRLEREGVIESSRYREHPPRYEYHLTAGGRELGRAVDALATWGLGHFPGTVRTIPSMNHLGDAE